jgi:hypothetical protein
MKERKKLSTIDAIMNLTHDIELSLKEKKSTTCVFLDVNEAYDYVSIKQLLNVMKKLQLSSKVLKWIEEFMNDRSIELAFDDKKQEKRQIRTEISQRSSISSILFLIYTRYLFAKLKIDVNIATSSFVDDIVIYTSSKRIELNCERLYAAKWFEVQTKPVELIRIWFRFRFDFWRSWNHTRTDSIYSDRTGSNSKEKNK